MPRLDTLWYEIDARTENFDQNILGSKKKLTDFVDYAKGHPGVVLGALAVAMIGVGAKATAMAAEIDRSMRKIEMSMPGATNEMGRLTEAFSELSTISPRSQAQLAEAAAQIAASGANNVAEIELRLRRAVDIADASGVELGRVIDGLDVVSDAFGLSAEQAATAMTRLFAASQGRVGLDEVITTLEKGGSVLATLGVRAEHAGEAMIALMDANVPRKQAGTMLTTILEMTNRVEGMIRLGGDQAKVGRIIETTLSRQNIESKGLLATLGSLGDQLAKTGVNLGEFGINANTVNAIQRVGAAAAADTRTEVEKEADAFDRLRDAAQTSRDSLQSMGVILKNQLNEALISLGGEILPRVLPLMKRFTDLLRDIRGGSVSSLAKELSGNLPTATPLGRASFRRGTRFETDAEEYSADYYKNLGNFVDKVGTQGKEAFGGMSATELSTLRTQMRGLLSREAQARAQLGGQRMNQLDVITSIVLPEAIRAAQEAEKGKTTPTTPTGDTTRRLSEDLKRAVESMRLEAVGAAASRTRTQVDDAEARLMQYQAKIEELRGKGAPIPVEAQNEVRALRGEITRIRTEETDTAARKIAGLAADATVTQVDNLKLALADLRDELSKMPGVTTAAIAQVTALQEALIEATAASEATDTLLQDFSVDDPTASTRSKTMLVDRMAELTILRDSAKTDAARKMYQEQILRIQQRINELSGKTQTLAERAAAADAERAERMRSMAYMISSAVDGALQLAQAFGIVDEKTAKALKNISDIATGSAEFAAAYQTGNVAGMFSSGMKVVGGIAGLVSKPENPEAARMQKENTAALRELTVRVGDLARINITGLDLIRAQKMLADPQYQDFRGGSDSVNRQIGAMLDAYNMTFEQLKELAKQFGVAIGTGQNGRVTEGDLDTLRDAMAKSEITKFADTFAGQLAQMDAAIRLFDLSSPIQQFEAFKRALDGVKGGGGALSNVLKEFDLSTAEGVEKARQALRDLFDQMQSGALGAADLGGLTPQELMDAILRARGLLDSQSASTGTGGYNVSRQITEVTGSRLAALASTANTFLEQIARNTGLLAGTNGEVPSITPPSMPGSRTAPNSPTFNLTINVPSGVADPVGLGERIGRGVVDTINRELHGDLLRARHTAGNLLAT